MVNENDSTEDSGVAGKTFRIGAVSRITQIPVDTLRAWERRYGVVSPARNTSAARLFNQDDVERLQLIKRLVDAGHAISSVATLSYKELEQRLDMHEPHRVSAADTPAAIDTLFVYRQADADVVDMGAVEAAGITIQEFQDDWNAFEADVVRQRPDAIVVLVATLLPDQALQIGRLTRRVKGIKVIVVYGFAATVSVERLNRDGASTLRAPVNTEQLLRECRAPTERGSAAPIPSGRPQRMFDDHALQAMAQFSAAVQCECPHHLVDIVRTLNQFESYSAECESRSDEDAALHAKLAETAAVARGLFERALCEVAQYEGIDLPEGVEPNAG